MTDRSGIEIDYCPDCRGVWLDRGELDKIIERSPSSSSKDTHYDNYSDKKRYSTGNEYKYKKKGFLGDIFDF
jgi:Zn-finger nucleic acid-binding protein